jgi:hypothetical protein
MYVVLLLLGALATALGLSLVATGVTAGGESEVTTPGTIAAVGGLVLIGLGLVLRELQRIEHALAARPMPRPARPVEAPAASVADRAGVPPRIAAPVPPKPEARPPSAPAIVAAPTPPATPAEAAALERLREKFPTLVRLENAPVVEEADASPFSQARAERVDELTMDLNSVNGAARANGAASARAIPSADGRSRKTPTPDRQKGSVFEAFWPSGQRRRSGQVATAQVAAPPVPFAEQEPQVSAEPVPANEEAPEVSPVAELGPPASETAALPPVSILKSGVVEGMAYALYSDGSIEAQLPQGRLRFNSITELRNHIDSVS